MFENMEIDKIIDELQSLEDDYPWCEQTDPPEIYVISSKGLYEGFSMYVYPIVGPYLLSEFDYKGIYENGSDHEVADDELDADDALDMFNAGCSPGVRYYKWSDDMREDEDFHEWDEIFEAFVDILIEYGEPVPWEDLADDDLKEWYEVLGHAKNGYRLRDEIPDK
jgi:hypothetical protein